MHLYFLVYEPGKCYQHILPRVESQVPGGRKFYHAISSMLPALKQIVFC